MLHTCKACWATRSATAAQERLPTSLAKGAPCSIIGSKTCIADSSSPRIKWFDCMWGYGFNGRLLCIVSNQLLCEISDVKNIVAIHVHRLGPDIQIDGGISCRSSTAQMYCRVWRLHLQWRDSSTRIPWRKRVQLWKPWRLRTPICRCHSLACNYGTSFSVKNLERRPHSCKERTVSSRSTCATDFETPPGGGMRHGMPCKVVS